VNSYSTAFLGGLRFKLWKIVSRLNEKHMLFAWLSLFGVMLTDLYIRQVSLNAFPDFRFF
jgi:hypothetical protein